MKGERFSPEHIIKIPLEAELRTNVKELCRKHGIPRQTFYNWRAREFFPGLAVCAPGGMVSVVGLFSRPVEFSLQELVYHGIHLSMGLVNLSRMNKLMSLLETGRIDLGSLATHIFSLDETLEAYDLFENHKDQCIKVILKS
jgi:alcohol dehydrogenase